MTKIMALIMMTDENDKVDDTTTVLKRMVMRMITTVKTLMLMKTLIRLMIKIQENVTAERMRAVVFLKNFIGTCFLAL